MNEMFKTTVDKACGDEFDLFEKAFNENPAHHNFSRQHKHRMNEVFKYCGDPVTARKKFERKPFWSGFGAKQAAAAAAGFVLGGGAIFGGVKAVDMLSEMSEYNENVNKRYDELLKDGSYYLEGDSSIYFKVENGAITLCGDREKIVEYFLSDTEMLEANPDSTEFLDEYAEDTADYFMTETKYAIVETGQITHTVSENIPQDLLKFKFCVVYNVDKLTEPWSDYVFLFSDRSLMFDGENTIRLYPLGNFIYSE